MERLLAHPAVHMAGEVAREGAMSALISATPSGTTPEQAPNAGSAAGGAARDDVSTSAPWTGAAPRPEPRPAAAPTRRVRGKGRTAVAPAGEPAPHGTSAATSRGRTRRSRSPPSHTHLRVATSRWLTGRRPGCGPHSCGVRRPRLKGGESRRERPPGRQLQPLLLEAPIIMPGNRHQDRVPGDDPVESGEDLFPRRQAQVRAACPQRDVPGGHRKRRGAHCDPPLAALPREGKAPQRRAKRLAAGDAGEARGSTAEGEGAGRAADLSDSRRCQWPVRAWSTGPDAAADAPAEMARAPVSPGR